jgi:hypothetical protein
MWLKIQKRKGLIVVADAEAANTNNGKVAYNPEGIELLVTRHKMPCNPGKSPPNPKGVE